MERKRRKSIVNQTILRVSVVFIGALILFTVIFSAYISTYMKDNILQSQQEQLDAVENSMENGFNSLTEPIVTLSEYTPATRLLSGYYKEYSPEWMDSKRSLDTYLQNANMFTAYIADINLIRDDSTAVYSMNNTLRSDYEYMDQSWFEEALQKPGIVKFAPPHGVDHLYNDKLRYTFTVIYPVERAGVLYGYVVMECNLAKMAEFVNAKNEENSGFILTDDQDGLIFSYKEKSGYEQIMQAGSLKNIEWGQNSTFQNDGKLYSAKRLASNGWTLILESDENVILSPIYRVLITVIVLGVLSLLILACIAVYMAKRMERPFNDLIERISSYDGSASREVREYEQTPWEVAVIRDKFEEMADNMNEMINEVYVAELKQKEMEMEALTNQINPHFLYNVFQVIQTKAVLADNTEIEDMIQALSMMMRYTMERKHEKVKIEREIEYIQNYLMFYKVRLSKVFDYEIEYPKEIAQYTTLKFILQPVVENCFKHGFKNKKSGGLIKISIVEQEGDIIFRVWDNGSGMGTKQLSQIRKRLDGELDEGGIGIVNTNQRLHLKYGFQYGLTIDSVEDEYTEVIIKIKKEG